jgi:hypothetical protein
MNPRLKASLLPVVKLLPYVLVSAMIGYLAHASRHYHWMLDDNTFREFLGEKNIADASFYFFHHANGRLFSHFYLCSVFSIFKTTEFLFVYHLLLPAEFALALSLLLKNYSARFYAHPFTNQQSFFYAAFITAFFFFLFFIGRIETWLWISSTGVYLISLILGMHAFALVLSKKRSGFRTFLAVLLFFIAGGFSESFAIMFLIALLWLDFGILKKERRYERLKLITNFSAAGSVGGILFNLFSNGAINRLDSLKQFDFMYSVKNTIHSLLLPFLNMKYAAGDLLLVIALFVYGYFTVSNFRIDTKTLTAKFIPVLLFIACSFFIPCYVLSDIVPVRAASLGYFVFTLFLFDRLIFRPMNVPRKNE